MKTHAFSTFSKKAGPFWALLIAWVICSVAVPNFNSLSNAELIVRQTAVVAVASLGMTLVVVIAGIDLAVGSIIALGTVTIARLLTAGYSPWTAVAATLLLGAAWGAFSGLCVTKGDRIPILKKILRNPIPPFAATLITLGAARAMAKALSHEQKVDAPATWLNGLLTALPPDHRWQLFPAGVWIAISLAVVVGVVLKYHVWGLNIIGVGSNPSAARNVGTLPVERIQVAVYAISGLLAAVGGVLEFSRLRVGDPTVATGYELVAIAAVVIGGGNLFGGRGSVAGTMCGALLMAVVRVGCTQAGLESWVQEVLTVAVIFVFMGFGPGQHKAAS
jgi:ribose/xylose/arabinose/galactoside ABC-type transport system permease subunit